MNNSHIEAIKRKIYFNPRNADQILEYVAKQHNIEKDALIEQFIAETSVHPYIYASLIDEANDQINEGLGDWAKDKIGAAKDAIVAKHGIGVAAKQKAIGSQQRRERMNFLYMNWARTAGKGNMQPTTIALTNFLRSVKVSPAVISKALTLFKPKPAAPVAQKPGVAPAMTTKQAAANLVAKPAAPAVARPAQPMTASRTNEALPAPLVIPANQLRAFFDKIAELEVSDQQKQLGTISKTQAGRAARIAKLAQNSPEELQAALDQQSEQ